jgi:hypothetical protein
MSLNLSQILPQLTRLGETITEQRRIHHKTLPKLREGLHLANEMGFEALQARVTAAGNRWPGAAPTDEPVDAVYPAPPSLSQFTVIGADGSQIYPDRHASAFYYLINIGSIRVTHGSQAVPVTTQHPSFYHAQDDLYDSKGRPIQPAMVNLRRDVAEMQALAGASRQADDDPRLALLDNSLLLWMTLEADAGEKREIDQLLADYLKAMALLRKEGVALAGFIDRPRNANTLALIHLAQLALEDTHPDTFQANPFRGLTDYDLFYTLLPEGSRSARFIYRSPLNHDFEKAGHQVQYFYLNPGPGERIVRIEIPAWVGEQPTLLNNLHAGLLQECGTTGGYPYVLVRAHELAVVNPRERELIEQQIERILLQFGEAHGPSQKSITKSWTQNRRRHHL